MTDRKALLLEIKKRMTISEVSHIIGVSCKTLMRLEKAGKTPKPKRDWRGWRVYDEDDLLRIKNFFETVFESE